MNVLSLFDGMSCGQIALNKLDIKVNNYYASEIDKYTIKVSTDNFPNMIHLGDVTKVNFKLLPKIDLLIGGSPCQGFSFAGKQLNFNDPRSALFFEFVRALKETNPKYFLLENVVMKKEYQDVISELLGVQPIKINSSLVSAQNRNRLYWTNISNVMLPEDKNIILPDILETGVVDRDKSYCIDANYFKGTNIEQYIKKCRRQVAFTERRTEEAKRIRKEYKELYGKDFCPRRSKELVAREDGKMNCLTASYSMKEHTLIDEKLYYRKLTPLECKRLQTVPDDYLMNVSDTQSYKMLGNGWTVDVIVHIMKNIKELNDES
jgi:DNA-cytosine methyltransferase